MFSGRCGVHGQSSGNFYGPTQPGHHCVPLFALFPTHPLMTAPLPLLGEAIRRRTHLPKTASFQECLLRQLQVRVLSRVGECWVGVHGRCGGKGSEQEYHVKRCRFQADWARLRVACGGSVFEEKVLVGLVFRANFLRDSSRNFLSLPLFPPLSSSLGLACAIFVGFVDPCVMGDCLPFAGTLRAL